MVKKENTMSKIANIFWKLLLAAAAFFVLTFTVYFFNLDMKLTAAIEPWLLKHYDTIQRDTHL